jgi:hypothetical protein
MLLKTDGRRVATKIGLADFFGTADDTTEKIRQRVARGTPKESRVKRRMVASSFGSVPSRLRDARPGT